MVEVPTDGEDLSPGALAHLLNRADWTVMGDARRGFNCQWCRRDFPGGVAYAQEKRADPPRSTCIPCAGAYITDPTEYTPPCGSNSPKTNHQQRRRTKDDREVIEDRLDQEQRIRLESLTMAHHTMAMTPLNTAQDRGPEAVIGIARKYEDFVKGTSDG